MSLSSDLYDVAYLEMVDALVVAPVGTILVVESKLDVVGGKSVWCKRPDDLWAVWAEDYTEVYVLHSTIGFNFCMGAWSLS